MGNVRWGPEVTNKIWSGKHARIEVLIDGEWVTKMTDVPVKDFNMEDFCFQELTPEMIIRRHFVTHYKHKFSDIRVIIEDWEITQRITNSTIYEFENNDHQES